MTTDWLKNFSAPSKDVFDVVGYAPKHHHANENIKARHLRKFDIGVIYNKVTNNTVIISLSTTSEVAVSIYYNLDPAFIWENLRNSKQPHYNAEGDWEWSGGIMDLTIWKLWTDVLTPHLNGVKEI